MGQTINLNRNTNMTLYGWMQKHYPAMREWAFEQKERHCEDYLHYSHLEDLDSYAYDTLTKIGSELPPPDKLSDLNNTERELILDLIYDHFDEYVHTIQEKYPLDSESLKELLNTIP